MCWAQGRGAWRRGPARLVDPEERLAETARQRDGQQIAERPVDGVELESGVKGDEGAREHAESGGGGEPPAQHAPD